jgi:Ca2+-binding EF-hand superfamily protein
MTKALLSLMLGGALTIAGALPVAAQDQPDASGDRTFASLDADNDGKLTAAEFGKLYEMEGKKATDQEKQKEFTAWDADGDGSVSKAEFSAIYSAAQPHQPERIEQPERPNP